MQKGFSDRSAVSALETWEAYHRGRVITEEELNKKTDIDNVIANKLLQRWWGASARGEIFELGCGASLFLAQAAIAGWRVNGIDYSQEGLDVLEKFLDSRNLDYGTMHYQDIFKFDWSSIENSIDVIISLGFLEHFTDPGSILAAASVALRPGGLVISQIPNLFSFNARLMERYAPGLWRQHIPYTPEEFDHFHIRAGLDVLEPAYYGGGYDQQMLIPWTGIRNALPLPLFRLLRYFSSFVFSPLMNLLPENGGRLYNPSVYGVYGKPV